MPIVLNVGGNSKGIRLPSEYNGWQQLWLDIDPKVNPDVLCDARNLSSLPAAQYDAIYCSHTLEHFYAHEVKQVLAGFRHVLSDDGLVHIRVPDLDGLMKKVAAEKLDIDDVLYQSPAGPVTVKDTIYGYGPEIEKSGSDFFAHKTGFTPNSLARAFLEAQLYYFFIGINGPELVAFAFKQKPRADIAKLFGLPDPGGETGA